VSTPVHDIVGITATRQDLPDIQRVALTELLTDRGVQVVRHGDCVGGDEAAHLIALEAGKWIVVHPPINSRYRAYCGIRTGKAGFRDQITWVAPAEYMDRNHAIVTGSRWLYAVPKEFTEVLRSGTWATIRYARKLHVPRKIVWPDGSITEEVD
jgi:hypothetical protein